MKWAALFSPALSWREPVPTQMPRETERTPGTCSVRIRTPLGSVFFHTSNHCNLALLYIFALSMDKYRAVYAPRRAIRSSTTAVMARISAR